MKIREHLGKTTPGLSLADEEHLQNRGIGAIVAVLRATLSLCDPDRLQLFTDGMMKVGGGALERRELVLRTGEAALHDETLVQAHEIGDVGFFEQIVTDRDAHRAEALGVGRIVHERRVHRDIAMIGHEQVRPPRIESVEPGPGKAPGRLRDDVVEQRFEGRLELVDGGEGARAAAQVERSKGAHHGRRQRS